MRVRRVLVAFLVVAILGASQHALGQERRTPDSKELGAKNTLRRKLSAQQIAQRTAPSVVLLLTTDEAGNPIALGSGFFVANDRIVTSYHVIKDASQIF